MKTQIMDVHLNPIGQCIQSWAWKIKSSKERNTDSQIILFMKFLLQDQLLLYWLKILVFPVKVVEQEPVLSERIMGLVLGKGAGWSNS